MNKFSLPVHGHSPHPSDEDLLGHHGSEASETSWDDDDLDHGYVTSSKNEKLFNNITLKQKGIYWFRQFFKVKKKPSSSPSFESVGYWLDYYNQLYQTKSPDVERFKILLNVYGMWDFKTPFKEGNDQFYNFHPECVFLADINFLLDRYIELYFQPRYTPNPTLLSSSVNSVLKEEQKKEKLKEKDSKTDHQSHMVVEQLFHDIQKNWMPIYAHRPQSNPFLSVADTVKRQSEKDGVKRFIWQQQALVNLEYLFHQNPLLWNFLKNYLHADNKKILCKMVYGFSAQKKQLLRIWQDQSWLSPEDVLVLEASNKTK